MEPRGATPGSAAVTNRPSGLSGLMPTPQSLQQTFLSVVLPSQVFTVRLLGEKGRGMENTREEKWFLNLPVSGNVAIVQS